MVREYTKEQIDKIFQKLPDELQETLFSMETTDAILNSCTKQGISGFKQIKVTEYVGYVLLGLILPQELARATPNTPNTCLL